MENIELRSFKGRVSWGSIFAGVITVLAVSILLSILGSSIGLYMIDPMASNPVSGVGTTMGIWTGISLLLSLAAGGFVGGKLAGSDGLIHGFLVWALTLFISMLLIICLAIGAAKLTSNILGSVASATGSIASGVGSITENGMSMLSNEAKEVFSDLNINTDNEKNNIQNNVREALKKSGVKEFQPEYLNNQLNEVKSELNKSLKKIVQNPNDADEIINSFIKQLQSRTDNLSAKINRNDLTKAIANNSNMSKAEIDKTVDEYIQFRDNAAQQGEEQLANLKNGVEQAKKEWDKIKHETLMQADKASHAAATSGLISFFALVIGALVCSLIGKYGANKTKEGYEA